MPTRLPAVAGAFYPLQADACRQQVEHYLSQAQPQQISGPILGGIVPHAGWVYSGATAARVYAFAVNQGLPETVVLLGAVHQWGVAVPTIYPAGSWRTPLGDVNIDDELGTALREASGGLVGSGEKAHRQEHSIEVQVPFIQHLMPQASILPIAVPSEENALDLGNYLQTAIHYLQRKVLVIASSDLTHYGPSYGFTPAGIGLKGFEWARSNDAHLLQLAGEMRAADLLAFAESQRSACGAGAIAALITYMQAMGAHRGQLLHYTTSYDVLPTGRPSDMVGYGAMVYA